MNGQSAASADQNRLYRLQLIRSANIGPVTYFQLIQRFGSARAALDAIPMLAARGGGKAPRIAKLDDIVREIEAVERLGARYLFLGEPGYPPLLSEIDTAPPALIVRGDAGLIDKPSVAIVGARNASAAACRFARELAQGLAQAGVVVVSGLARGIDTAAHQGALGYQGGLQALDGDVSGTGGGTAGIIASGIDIAYPPENAALQEQVATQGILIAEQPPGREPLARHFPYRNRIIAGMTLGTVIVEAAPRSGSLITARLANECGREVMAVPGSPLDPRAQGCNHLIREGATLIQSVEDIIEIIRPIAGHVAQPGQGFRSAPSQADPSDQDRKTIIDLIGHAPVHVDELVRQSALPPASIQMVLLELELAGGLERHAGGRVSRV
jgi:DNA processing protein